jgi:hypothetical protein
MERYFRRLVVCLPIAHTNRCHGCAHNQKLNTQARKRFARGLPQPTQTEVLSFNMTIDMLWSQSSISSPQASRDQGHAQIETDRKWYCWWDTQ